VRLDGTERAWLDALAAETGQIESGGAQLRWAVGALRLVLLVERRQAMNRVYRLSPVVPIVLGILLFTWLAFSLAHQYALLAAVLGVLSGIGLLVTLPTLVTLVWLTVKLVSRWLAHRQLDQQRVRRMWARLALVAGALCLVSLLGVGLLLRGAVNQMLAQGPATAGIVIGPAERGAVEGALRQMPGIARPDIYLTTLVKPLAVNGVPLAQLPQEQLFCPPKYPGSICPTPTGQQLAQVAQGIADKFSGVQGFDLAHGQMPRITGFENGAGATGPGPNQMVGPWGRQLDASDANTYNVMVSANQIPLCPRDYCGNYMNTNGDVVSVQSLVTGQIVNLRIVGQYWLEDGQSAPLFGKVLAADSVVRTLSGGDPSNAYALRVDASQRQALFARMSIAAPAAHLYDFTGIASGAQTSPAYTSFTDVSTEEGYFAWEHAWLTLQAALSAALLAAIIIVASWVLRAVALGRRRPSAAPGI
jgi:hypothetical protein